MSKSAGETKRCHTCGEVKPLNLFPKWRTKCRTCKSAENSTRLKERYATDPKFAARTKDRATKWQRANAERTNEYHRRRHAAKIAAGDNEYISQMSAAQRRYRESTKGKKTTAARMKQYEENGQAKAWRVARRLKPESRASQMLSSTRTRALKAGLDFTLDFDDVYPAVAAGTCQATGLPFDLSGGHDWLRHPRAPSIDRVDNAKGYTPDNIQVVIWQYNTAKGPWPQSYLDEMLRAIVDKTQITGV